MKHELPDWEKAYMVKNNIPMPPADYFRVDYLLRAALIPAGYHVVEFKDEAPLFHQMNVLTMVGSVVLALVAAGDIVLYCRKKT